MEVAWVSPWVPSASGAWCVAKEAPSAIRVLRRMALRDGSTSAALEQRVSQRKDESAVYVFFEL